MSKILKLPRFTLRKKNPLKIKGIAYKSCVRSAMLYGSETLSLGQNELAILQLTERAMVINVLSEINGQEVDKRSNADVGLECNNRSAGEG